jgi:hypothetical protein
MDPKPPLDIEEALDLVLAAAAHRSSNERHAEFGRILLDEYFVKLRERYKADELASRYLDNLFACVASAVRAFSVERDIFGTRWNYLLQQRKYAIERANSLDRYSPFKEEGVWGKVFSIIGGGGLGGLVGEFITNWLGQSNVLLIFSIGIGVLVGLFAIDFLLNLYRERVLAKVEKDFPRTLEESWRQETLAQYKLILRQFLLSAIKVREEWYPHLPTINGKRVFMSYDIQHIQFEADCATTNEAPGSIESLWKELDKIVERHMAFHVNT